VGRAKTNAGTYREVDLPGGLVDELAEWKARCPTSEPDDPVFVTRASREGCDNGAVPHVGRFQQRR
jgi:hypothetical protein